MFAISRELTISWECFGKLFSLRSIVSLPICSQSPSHLSVVPIIIAFITSPRKLHLRFSWELAMKNISGNSLVDKQSHVVPLWAM